MADSSTKEPSAPQHQEKDVAGAPASKTLPPPEELEKAAGLEVIDMDGKAHSFASLYTGPDVASRVLIIFVRHVFCGSCHAYLATVSPVLTPEVLKAADASIVIIGCGDPALITSYQEYSSTQAYQMYMDPSEKLYQAFGTGHSTARGASSTYAHDTLPQAVWKAFGLMKQHFTNALFYKGGKAGTIGGEFLFETVGEDGKRGMTWCHRMENTTDHTSVEGLKKLLGA